MTEPNTQTRPRSNSTASRVVAALVALLLVAAFVVSFLGWGTSGARTRNSYELVRSVRTLDLLDGLWATLAPVWFALPLVVAIGLVATGFGWRLLAAFAGFLVGGLLILGWFQVKNSILGVDAGATTGVINGVALIASSLLQAALATREFLRKE